MLLVSSADVFKINFFLQKILSGTLSEGQGALEANVYPELLLIFCCGLTSQSTAMVMLNLTLHFLGQA